MTKVLRYSAALLFVTALSLLVGGSAAAQSTNNPRYRQFRDTAAASITTPAAGNVRLFFDDDGFYWKNSAGTVTPVGSSISGLTAGVIPQAGSATSLVNSKMTASGTNGGTWTLYDDTATVGVTQLVLREGAGQGTTPAFIIRGAAALSGFRITTAASNGATFSTWDGGQPSNVTLGTIHTPDSRVFLGSQVNKGFVSFDSTGWIRWGPVENNAYNPAHDIGVERSSAGVLRVTNGSTGVGKLWAGDADIYDDTATTGVTQFLIKEGAGQGFTAPFAVKDNLGNTILRLNAWAAGTYLAAGGLRHVSDTDNYFALLAGQLYLDTDSSINSALGGPGIWFKNNIYSTPATAIVNESDGVIGLKSTTNNSRLNIYGAYTDTSNYERLSLYYDSGFSGFAIDTSAAGTGSTRHLKIGASNGLYLYAGGDINTLAGPYGTVTTGSFTTDASSFYSNADVVLSLGRPTHRWRNAYIGHSVQSGDEVTLAADNTVSPVTQVSCATADSVVAGYVSYTVSVADTTNHLVQTETGNVPFLLINENGTVTATVGTVFGQVIDSAGGAAITTTWSTAVTGTNTMIRATVDYDTATLTGTVVKTITSRVYVNSGTATVTPQ